MIVPMFLRNISYSISANLITTLISIFMIVVAPKFLSHEDYGLWQLFLFYFYYMGFSQLGWREGIYLRYADKDFENLDRKLFAGQFYGFIFFQIIILICITILIEAVDIDPVKRLALTCAIWLAPFVNFTNLSYSILQMTNRIKSYAQVLALENIVFFLGLIIFLIFLHCTEFKYLYYAKVLSLLSITFISLFFCRNLMRPKIYPVRRIIIEAKNNIIVGSKLMVAYLAGMLVLGIVRYGISIGWDVSTFGKVSLALGISNFLIGFISAISIVFFPLIKRMNKSRWAHTYIQIRLGLDSILFALLFLYYPLQAILLWWLPQYADSLLYLNLLFPICLFDSKLHILVNTYFKSMRQESLMLKLNILTVLFSVVVTCFTVFVLHNLDLTIFSIILIYAFQCFVAEYSISRLLNIDLIKDIVIDLVICIVFIGSSWYIHNAFCIAIYSLIYLVFLLSHKNELRDLLSEIKAIKE